MTAAEIEKNRLDYLVLFKQNCPIDINVLTALDRAFTEIENDRRVRYFDKYKALNIILSFISFVNRFKIFKVLTSRNKLITLNQIDTILKNLKNYHLVNNEGFKAMYEVDKLGLHTEFGKAHFTKEDVENLIKVCAIYKNGSTRNLEKSEFREVVCNCISLENEFHSEFPIMSTRMEIMYDAFVTLEKYLSVKKFKSKKEVQDGRGKDERFWTEYKRDRVKTLIGKR